VEGDGGFRGLLHGHAKAHRTASQSSAAAAATIASRAGTDMRSSDQPAPCAGAVAPATAATSGPVPTSAT
jgi:hypothetical protein